MMKQMAKYLILLMAGGAAYIIIEMLWRGHSHWTMFLLGGVCFVCLGLINEVIPWTMPLWRQVIIGVCIITLLEFLTGCVINLWLGWNIWDYSSMRWNLHGQISLGYFLLWLPVSLAAIILDDWLRYWLFGEEKPHYKLF